MFQNLPHVFDSGAYRIFFDSWIFAWQIVAERTANFCYLAIVASCVLGLLGVLSSGGTAPRLGAARLARYVVAGAIAALCGYLPYLVSISHLAITQRVFLAVAPGAGLIALALVVAACRVTRLPVALAVAVPICLGLVAQIYQHDQYARA